MKNSALTLSESTKPENDATAHDESGRPRPREKLALLERMMVSALSGGELSAEPLAQLAETLAADLRYNSLYYDQKSAAQSEQEFLEELKRYGALLQAVQSAWQGWLDRPTERSKLEFVDSLKRFREYVQSLSRMQSGWVQIAASTVAER